MISVDLYLLWGRFKRASLWSSKGFTVLIALILVICVFKVIHSLFRSKLSSFTSTGSEFLKDFFNPKQVLFQWEWAFQREWSLLCVYSPRFGWGSFHSLCWRAFTELMNLIEIGSRTQKYKFFLLFVRTTWNGKTASLDFLGLHTPFHTLCELSLFRRDCWTLGPQKKVLVIDRLQREKWIGSIESLFLPFQRSKWNNNHH